MRERLTAAAPSLYAGAVSAVSAFLGTRFSSDQDLTGAIWAACALALFAAAARTYYNTRTRCHREVARLEREVDEERYALYIGRRALRTWVVVLHANHVYRADTVAKHVADLPDGGGITTWVGPYVVRWQYAPPIEQGDPSNG